MIDILRKLSFDENIIKYNKIQPDFIISEVSEGTVISLAFSFRVVTDRASMEAALSEYEQLQRSFKHCFALIVASEQRYWNELNLSLSGGLLRLIRCEDLDAVAASIKAVCSEMSDSEKLRLQREFFSEETQKLTQKLTAKRVMSETLRKLTIPQGDAQLIIDGTSTLKALITVDLETLNMTSPADNVSLQSIHDFFYSSRDA